MQKFTLIILFRICKFMNFSTQCSNWFSDTSSEWNWRNNDHQLLNSDPKFLRNKNRIFYQHFFALFMQQSIIDFTYFQQFNCKTSGRQQSLLKWTLRFWSSVEYLIIVSQCPSYRCSALLIMLYKRNSMAKFLSHSAQ